MVEDMLTAPVPAWVVVLIVFTEGLLQLMNGTLGRSKSAVEDKKPEKED